MSRKAEARKIYEERVVNDSLGLEGTAIFGRRVEGLSPATSRIIQKSGKERRATDQVPSSAREELWSGSGRRHFGGA